MAIGEMTPKRIESTCIVYKPHCGAPFHGIEITSPKKLEDICLSEWTIFRRENSK